MGVLWTDVAASQLQAVHDYVAQTSPEYARRLVDRLTRRSEQIGAFPFSGRAVPEYDLPEVRQVIESSYRIIYLIAPEQVEVLAVIHTSRRGLSEE